MTKKRTIGYLVAGGLAACLLPACGADTERAAEAVRIEELANRVKYLEDVAAIQKVQSRYAHYLFTQDFDKIVEECFPKNINDVTVEFSDSGVFRGLDSVKALYKAFEATKQIPGFFILHMTVNPYIEVSKDGKSARSHWLSPGATGSPGGARWVWGPYYVDYVKEDGEWRIQHSNLAALFRNPYETSWTKTDDHGTVQGSIPAKADAPSTLYKPYNERRKEPDMFRLLPDLPKPY